MATTFTDATTASGSTSGITVTQSRRWLLRWVKGTNETWTDAELDRANQNALKYALQVVAMSTGETDVSLSQGDSTVDLTSQITGFTQNDFINRATISNSPVKLAPYLMVNRRWEGGTPSQGQPTLIGFRNDDYALFDKPADQSYTLNVVYRKDLVSYTPGCQGAWSSTPTYQIDDVVSESGSQYRCIQGHTNQQPPNTTYWESTSDSANDPDNTNLNVPQAWVGPLIHTLGMAYLLSGAHVISAGSLHPSAGTLFEKGEALLQEAAKHFPRVLTNVRDPNTPAGA